MLLSVVIPTCNRPDLAERCLASLTPEFQGLDRSEFELVVSDDGKDERTKEMIAARGFAARWQRGPRRGPAANRNHGARLAGGEWTAFIDDDCQAGSGWLRAIRSAAARGDADVVEGMTTIPDKVDHPFRLGVENVTGDQYWSCNLAVRSAVFARMGGFDEDFLEAGGEDMEFGWRLRADRTIRRRFVPEALVYHPVRALSWRGLLWRTKLARWMSVYHLKTGASPDLDASPARVALALTRGTVMECLRGVWHYARDFKREEWKTRTFWLFWRLLTLPVVLPYRVLWEIRFRKELRRRTERTGLDPA